MVAIRTDRTGAGGIAIAAPLLVILGAAAAAGLYAEAPRLLMLAIGAILAPFALVIAYRYPGAVFAAYLCTPFYKAGLQPYVPVDVTILLSVLCFLQLPFMFMAGTGSASVAGRSVRWRNALVIWTAFTGVMILGVVYAPDTQAATDSVVNWMLLTFLPSVAAIRIARDRRYLAQLLWSLFAIGASVVIAGLWLLPTVGDWPNDRLRVFGAHTIRVGQAALLVPMIAVPFAFRTGNSLARTVAVVSIPPALLVAASSGSRGPLLMLVLTGLVFSLRRLVIAANRIGKRPKTVRPLRYLIPGILLMILLAVLPVSALGGLVPERSAERLATISTILGSAGEQDLEANAPDASTADRVRAYDVAEEMFMERPLLGHGTFSFASLLQYYDPQLAWPETVAHPHNLALQVAAEYGIVGLLVLAAFVAVAFRRGFRLASSPEWTTIFLLAYFFLLCAMVSTEMRDNRMLWGLLFLLLLAPDPGALDAAERTSRREGERANGSLPPDHELHPLSTRGIR